jgi:hypothetical protein
MQGELRFAALALAPAIGNVPFDGESLSTVDWI